MKPSVRSVAMTFAAASTRTSKPFSGLSRPAEATIRRRGDELLVQPSQVAQVGVGEAGRIDGVVDDRDASRGDAARRTRAAWPCDTQTTWSIQLRFQRSSVS